jgi:hypothetical protein
MPLRVNLIGNRLEGKGLASDARMLRAHLEAWGHVVADVQYDARVAMAADLNIFLEVCAPRLHGFARTNVLIPNIELWFEHQHGHTRYDRIWAKTEHAATVLRRIGRGAEVIGFTTEDARRPEIPRVPSFLHVAGGSRYRNTDVVLDAWRAFWRAGMPDLTVIALPVVTQRSPLRGTPGVRWVERIEPREAFLAVFHLLPGEYEGYGVALWEARSAGAAVITTDAPPMSDGPALMRIPVKEYRMIRPGCLVEGARVDRRQVWRAVLSAQRTPWASLVEAGAVARAAWEEGRRAFTLRLRAELERIEGRIAA